MKSHRLLFGALASALCVLALLVEFTARRILLSHYASMNIKVLPTLPAIWTSVDEIWVIVLTILCIALMDFLCAFRNGRYFPPAPLLVLFLLMVTLLGGIFCLHLPLLKCDFAFR